MYVHSYIHFTTKISGEKSSIFSAIRKLCVYVCVYIIVCDFPEMACIEEPDVEAGTVQQQECRNVWAASICNSSVHGPMA